MSDGIAHLAIPAWSLVVRPIVIYLALMLGLRLFGKRQIGQFTTFDLAMVLLITNAVQPAMTGPDTSLLGGLIILGTLLVVNGAIGMAESRSHVLQGVFEGHPTIIVQGGEWLERAMRREGIDQQEAEMALREHGVDDVSRVKLAVLETDGTISVVPFEALTSRTARRLRRFPPRR